MVLLGVDSAASDCWRWHCLRMVTSETNSMPTKSEYCDAKLGHFRNVLNAFGPEARFARCPTRPGPSIGRANRCVPGLSSTAKPCPFHPTRLTRVCLDSTCAVGGIVRGARETHSP